MTARFIDLDTGTVRETSDRDFLRAWFGSDEQRAERDRLDDERCIRAILRGDTYGWPPVMVDRCQAIIAEREAAECGPDPLIHLEPKRKRAA